MRQRVPMWVPRVAVAAGLLGLVAWSFQQRWTLLAASPFPLGVDGYFYPVELRASLPPPLGLHPRHPDGLVLVAEPTWAWVVAQLPPDEQARYRRWPTR